VSVFLSTKTDGLVFTAEKSTLSIGDRFLLCRRFVESQLCSQVTITFHLNSTKPQYKRECFLDTACQCSVAINAFLKTKPATTSFPVTIITKALAFLVAQVSNPFRNQAYASLQTLPDQ